MPDVSAAIKRVPKWAWLTSGGVAIGGIAAYTLHNRKGVEDPAATDNADPNAAVTGYPTSSAPSPVPGIVVPDVNVVGGGDGQSNIDLTTTYLDAIQALFDELLGRPAAVPSPATPTPVVHAPVVTGGGVPTTPRPGVVVAQPPPAHIPPPVAPARKPCCTYAGHPLSWWHNPTHARRHGKWNWPFDTKGYVHSKPFAGRHACDGGGTAGGSKREC